MVCAMEAGNSNCSDEVRSSSSALSSTNVNTVYANCSSARQSPKITMPSASISAASPSTSSILHRNLSSPSLPRKIMSKNFNHTVFPTTYPSNMAELQLYRVMQNASLLYYYDTLLEMGGDDVQQLCDAGEEEFLEIMSLVGMASKPLHVRRFQKSLQEWVTNSTKFKTPLVLGDDFELEVSSPRISSNHGMYAIESSEINRPIYSPSSGEVCALPQVVSPGLTLSKRPYSPMDNISCLSSSSSPGNNSSLQLTPTLGDSQITKLAAAAERLSKQLPQLEPKPYNTKKKMSKELELVMSMSDTDPRRMDEIRRYAAIYGRFDCKRRPEKPLTLHEVSVNEAAAQICRFIPALLTRRDELFPLARQVVKDSGCHYSKTQISSSSSYIQRLPNYERDTEVPSSLSRTISRISSSDSQENSSKRLKLDNEAEGNDQGLSRQDRNSNDLSITRNPIQSLFQIHAKTNSCRESTARNSSAIADYEETDSHFSYSNSSSPYQTNQEVDNSYQKNENYLDSGSEDGNKFSPKIVAASGDNIIAVANPALAMSPAMLAVDTRDKKVDG